MWNDAFDETDGMVDLQSRMDSVAFGNKMGTMHFISDASFPE